MSRRLFGREASLRVCRSLLTLLALLVASPDLLLAADDQPVSILAQKIGGHIHPSICRTKDGTLVCVFKGSGGLVAARSNDGGRTWDAPQLIPTTPKRPDVIRESPKFEVYPGTADTLPDDRVLVTWNYIADDKAKDGYYERALLYSLSSDGGKTWTEQALIGPVDGHHLGAVRHNVLPWSEDRWLLPLRVGPPRLFSPKTGQLAEFTLYGKDGKSHAYQQIVRTSKGTILAMGPVFLRSTDEGRSWTEVANFSAVPDGDSAEGRYLNTLADGRVLVTWGVGNDNRGLRYNYSADDGVTWNTGRTVTLLPDTHVMARYYSARTIELEPGVIGSVYMNGQGVHFLRVDAAKVCP